MEENISSDISGKVEIQETEDIKVEEENTPVIIDEVIVEEPVLAETSQNALVIDDDWKPMNFDVHIPDALIGKSEIQVKEEKLLEPELEEEIIPEPEVAEVREAAPVTEEVTESEIVEEVSATEPSERPVINYSFFGATDADKAQEEVVKPDTVTEDLQGNNEEKWKRK